MKSDSNLEKVLTSGEFAITGELGPPMSSDAEEVKRKAKLLKGCVDAVNITDNQTAVVRMSSIAAAVITLAEGVEPVMQMTCRDRNRICLQSDALGAYALGLRNCLCLSGDHQSFGGAGKLHGHPGAKNVYDLDSIQLLDAMAKLRDQGIFQGGDTCEHPPKMFLGAAWTPLGDPIEFRVTRLAKKIEAGADFIQTQGIYDIDAFAEQMKKARAQGLTEKTKILVGIIVPKSRGMLKYMHASVAGITVPDALIERFPIIKKDNSPEEKKAKRKEAEKVAVDVTIELIDAVKQIEGVAGVHLQAIEWEDHVKEIVEKAGLFPRPGA